RQLIYFPASEEKIPLLIGLLSKTDAKRSMIFVNMKVAAEKVSRRLERQGFAVGMLSGDVPQKKRQSLLGKFQRGEIEVLIATDVAARGLHIPDVSHVYNYDLPQDAEDYVHRIGRTARLGAEGDAISFACDMYAQSLPDIEAYIGQKIPVGTIDPAMLALPPPRHRPAPPAGTAVVEEDDGSIETRPPPRQRTRPGSERRPDRNRPERARSAPPAAAQRPASSEAATTSPAAGERRSRRGGRGRRGGGAARREGTGHDAKPAASRPHDGGAAAAHAAPRQNGEGRGRDADKGVRTAPPSATPAATAARQKKPGFFHRLTRLFKR
ncbi:MAG TPA: helicase-related protein, partial [Rudaea sp.]|nr:helicase-related protein [Rudaea sp.]